MDSQLTTQPIAVILGAFLSGNVTLQSTDECWDQKHGERRKNRERTKKKLKQRTKLTVQSVIESTGGMTTVSMLAMPLILQTAPTSSTLLNHWKFVYTSGHKQGPTISIAAGLAYWFAAGWSLRSGRGEDTWIPYTAAGAITMSMIPYTWAMILPTNNALFANIKAETEGKATSLQANRELVKRWRLLNLSRVAFPLAGAILGLLTLVGVVRM